jgi:hypothetical protein
MDCVRCGQSLSEATSLLCADGLVCEGCQADEDLQALFLKGTRQYASAAFGLAVLSNVLGFFGIFALAALLTSLRFFKDVKTADPDHQKALMDLGLFPKVLAVFALVTGVVNLVILATQVLGL